MRVGFWQSNLGGSPLLVGLWRGLQELGHTVEEYMHGRHDLVFMFNQTAHDRGYFYPDFPSCGAPLVFIDSAEYGYYRRLPDRIHEHRHAFAEGSLSHDTKNRFEQEKLRDWLRGRSFPYLLREKHVGLHYPAAYHPIDYPLYAYSVCHKAPDREQYLRRSEDLFHSWGGSHPWRVEITKALRGGGYRVLVIEENGTVRMPQDAYFDRMFGAKATVSFDGYGVGSFRRTEALVRTLLLDGPITVEQRAPLIDGDTCLKYTIANRGTEWLATDIVGVLDAALADPERSFDIYKRGYEHCMTHLTERATAAYVLGVAEGHDWTVPQDVSW